MLDILADRHLGCPYQLLLDPKDYVSASGPCLNYSRQRLRDDEVFIPACGLLRGEGIKRLQPEGCEYARMPALFPEYSPGSDFPFDLLALVFFLLSRYEEYGSTELDKHGRYPAGASLALRAGFLDRPLVDEWIQALGQKLLERHPRLVLAEHPFQLSTTYDIDHAWAYLHRPWWHQLASSAKAALRLDTEALKLSREVRAGRTPDPFDRFDYLEKLERRYGLRSRYFFLLPERRRGPDRSIPPRSPALRQLIRHLAERYAIGIHPSYGSQGDPRIIMREIETLREITGQQITHSRQHFLRLRLPDTYRHLLACGITHDHTMGYAGVPGFRASTARPFPWYDVEREQATRLMVHPFQLMDGTLKNYMGLTPSTALEPIWPVIDRIRAVGGSFTCIWHNSSFGQPYGWSGWKAVYENLLAGAARNG